MSSKQIKEPMFISFANGRIDMLDVARRFANSTPDEKAKGLVEELSKNPSSLNTPLFLNTFRVLLKDLIEHGLAPFVTEALSSYTSPSLIQYERRKAVGSSGFDERWVGVKDEGAPWVEGVLCYNLMAFIRLYGASSIKQCTCGKFFAHKGPYAKYCSEACKKGSS